MYENGFHAELKKDIKTRLQYQQPNHFHSEPYDFQDFHNCAHFLLAGTTAKLSTISCLLSTSPTAIRYSTPIKSVTRYPPPVCYDLVIPKVEPVEPSVSDLFCLVSQQLAVLTQALTERNDHWSKPCTDRTKPTTSGQGVTNFNQYTQSFWLTQSQI
jgi:hypothetical protein